MTFEEYRRHDALGLANLVKTGAVSPETLLELAIQREAAVNPKINAVIHRMYDDARAQLAALPADAPFKGVPFLIKDLGVDIKGHPHRYGSRGYTQKISAFDSYAAVKMRQNGLVLMGKTNTPEFGLTPFTEPVTQGATRNPWNTDFTTGGSSGGSGAAVAAGIVPMATANDGGGSIRIPASCNGLFGLKSSRGRISWGPAMGDMWNGASVEGCVSRSVRDSAAYLDAMIGAMPGDPYFLPLPERPYLSEQDHKPAKLKIGYMHESPVGTPVDQECIDALNLMVDTLRALGHTVEAVPSPYTKEDLTHAFLPIVASETAADLQVMKEFLGRKVTTSDVELNTYGLGLLGQHITGGEYAYAKKLWNHLSRRAGDFHLKYDMLLTPTMGLKPFKIGTLQNSAAENIGIRIICMLGWGKLMRLSVEPLAQKIYSWMPWTAMANMTGQPSMSVPALRTKPENLPIGTMFTAAIGREDQLFNLAFQLEKALNWDKDQAQL